MRMQSTASTEEYQSSNLTLVTNQNNLSLLETVKRNTVSLSGLLGSHLLVDIYNSLLPIISPLLILKYGLSLGTIGLLSALLSFTGAFLQPLYGYLCDRFGNRWLLPLAPILIAIACTGLAYAPSFGWITICLILLGTGFSLYHPKSTALVGSLSKEHRHSLVSFFVASGSLGSALSPFFVLLFINEDIHSLKNLSLSWIPALIAFFALWFAGQNSRAFQVSQKKPKLSLKQALAICSKKDLILLSLIVASRSATILTLIAFMPQLINQSWAQSLTVAGYAATFLNLGSFIGGLTGGAVSERFNPRMALALSLMISAPCFLGFLFYKSIALLALGSFFSAWSNSISVSLSQEVVPSKVQSVASSLTMGFAWGVGAMIIPVVGWIADLTSLQNVLYYFLSIPLILAGTLCLFLHKKRTPPA